MSWLTLDQAARLVRRPAWVVRAAVLMDEVTYTLTDDEHSYLVLESSLRRRFRIRPRRERERDWGLLVAAGILGAALFAGCQARLPTTLLIAAVYCAPHEARPSPAALDHLPGR